jgi:hypothetical protein
MNNTTFIEDIIKQGSNLKDIINIISSNNDKIIKEIETSEINEDNELISLKNKLIQIPKIKELSSQNFRKKTKDNSNIKIEFISIDNKDIDKLTIGTDSGKGKHKYYQITETIPSTNEKKITVIELYNYYGWVSNSEPYRTSNMLRIITFENEPFDIEKEYSSKIINILNEIKDTLSIREIEKKIKEIYGMEISTSNKVKYSDIYDFIDNNPKLFNKYIQEIFKDKIFYFDYEEASIFDDSIKIPRKINFKFRNENNIELIPSTEFRQYLEILRKKINNGNKLDKSNKTTVFELSRILKKYFRENENLLENYFYLNGTGKYINTNQLMIFDQNIISKIDSKSLKNKFQQYFSLLYSTDINIDYIDLEFFFFREDKDEKLDLNVKYN